MNSMTFSFGSVTYAIKAKNILLNVRIHSKLVKLDSANSANGCIYGLYISPIHYAQAVSELKKYGMTFSVYPD